MASESQDQAQPPPPRQPAPAQHQLPLGEIHAISRGFARGEESNSARKAHLCSIISGGALEVQAISKLPRLDTTITFSDSDMEGCQHPHDDPLMIRVVVANKIIYRVLVDNGSSVDIIFTSAFDKMGIGREKLEPVNTYLRGFSRERVMPLGSTQLMLTLGNPPCQATTTVRFLIVDAPLAYNMLLGSPSLNTIRVIPSAYHRVIKFPTANGVGIVRGNQRIARECYSASMKQKMVDNIYMDEFDMRDKVSTRPAPSEELEPIQLDDQPETSGRLIKWAIELSEFDIRCKPRTTVKGKSWQISSWISPNRACRSYTTDARPPHLEVVRGRGRQCPRKRCRSDPDLPRWDRCGIRPQVRLPSLQ